MKYFRSFFPLMVLLAPTGAFGQTKLNTIQLKDHKALQEFFRYAPGKRPLLCGHRGGAMKVEVAKAVQESGSAAVEQE